MFLLVKLPLFLLFPTISSILLTKTESVIPGNRLFPLPQKYEFSNETIGIELSSSFNITSSENSDILNEAMKRYMDLIYLTGYKSQSNLNTSATLPSLDVSVENIIDLEPWDADESYYLHVPINQTSATLKAKTVFGALRGLETFSQLIQAKTEIPGFILAQTICNTLNFTQKGFIINNAPWTITDQPRFKHRGLLLDTSRHYITTEKILNILDIMSFGKLNVLHWHIVDSQSFPTESIVNSNISKYGAYSQWQVYTKQDIDNVVKYALYRGITVVPEYDMPGHAYSWGKFDDLITVCAAKQPWTKYCAGPPCGNLNITSPYVINMVKDLITEQKEWFKGPIFHLGNDEINIPCYEDDLTVAAFLKDNNMTAQQLVVQFDSQIVNFTTSEPNSKISMFWEEAVLNFDQSFPPETIIQVWISVNSVQQVADKGYRIVVSPSTPWYLDCGRGSVILFNKVGF